MFLQVFEETFSVCKLTVESTCIRLPHVVLQLLHQQICSTLLHLQRLCQEMLQLVQLPQNLLVGLME